MDNKASSTLITAISALGLGILGDALLRESPWGINIGLWIGALIAVTFLVTRAAGIRLSPGNLWPTLPAIIFVGGFAWRDSAVLRALDLAAVFISLGLVVWRAQGGTLFSAGVTTYLGGVFDAAGQTVVGFAHLVFRDVDWSSIPQQGVLKRAPATMTGVAIAMPLLLAFGGLFMAADAAYRQLVVKWLEFDPAEFATNVGVIWAGAWFAGGYLRPLVIYRGEPPLIERGRRTFFLGTVEINTALGLINFLFLTFVLVQFRYLFGGAGLIETIPGMKYATYAREGFYELLAVSALVLPVLLLADWALDEKSGKRGFRIQAVILMALLTIVMASAAQRLWLYQAEYGLTELRVYGGALLCWLALVFICFVVTVLRGRRETFAFAALATTFATLLALHILNPDAFIVRVNAARPATGRHFDARYAASLSADATRELIRALPVARPGEQRLVAEHLVSTWVTPAAPDWRTWNWSRSQSIAACRDNAALLRRLASGDEPDSQTKQR